MYAHSSDTFAIDADDDDSGLRWRRARCRRCNGSGFIGDGHAACSVCHQHWPRDLVASWLDGQVGGWWGYRIPFGAWLWRRRAKLLCGHHVEHLDYWHAPCQTCHRYGWIELYATREGMRRQLEAQAWASYNARMAAQGYTPVPWHRDEGEQHGQRDEQHTPPTIPTRTLRQHAADVYRTLPPAPPQRTVRRMATHITAGALWGMLGGRRQTKGA